MAKSKKRKKLSVYDKQRKKLLAKVNYWKKKGLIVNIDIPLTEKQLRDQGISGSALTKEINKIKKLNKEFANQEYFSPSSGEVFSNQREARETASNDGDLAWDRFYNEFYLRLTEPIPYSRDRARRVTDLSREKQKSLLYIVRDKVAQHSERWVGKQLLLFTGESGLNAIETLRIVMYDSTQEAVEYSYYDLLRAFQPNYERMDMYDIMRYEDEAESYVSELDDYY